MMRLSCFIIEHLEPILQEWESFARTLETPGKPLDRKELRDHAELILRTIAADLDSHQSAFQQVQKSHGHGPSTDDTAAESHAITRLMAGFSIDQVVAEYRALRASVIRHWMLKVKSGQQLDVEAMIRFNEAIDQALTEAIASYTSAVQVSRNIFLGILGHDLRTPLNAILLGADVLLRTDDLGERATKITSKIYTSVKRASHIVGDLLDFTRSQLGPGIPVKKAPIDIAPACERVVEEARTVYPQALILLTSVDSVHGDFDGARLEQVFSNLIGNGVQHGFARTPVTVTLDRAHDVVVFSVHNSGKIIPPELLSLIFNPMGRYSPQASSDHGPYASLGLGLFIASQIVSAHDGLIEVFSDEVAGTKFVVKIPLTSRPDLAGSS